MSTPWRKLYRTNVLKAIVLGQLMINLPVLLFTFGGIPLIKESPLPWYWKIALAILNLILGFLISLRYWQYMITRWRLKAYSLVPKEHWLLLQDWAKQTYLLHEGKSVWDDIEKRSDGEHAVLSEIEELLNHFENVELIKTDLEAPWRLSYTIKKGEAWLELGLRFFFFGAGFYWLFGSQWYLGLISMLIVVLYGNRPNYFKMAYSGQPVLAVSESGFDLSLPSPRYIPWSEVRDLELDLKEAKLTIHYYAEGKKRKQRLNLATYSISDIRKFFRLLQVYGRRHAKYQYALQQERAKEN